MYCKNCGKKIDGSEKFCRHCGGRINDEVKTTNTSRVCPFCKEKINFNDKECPICHRILVERIIAPNNPQRNEIGNKHIQKGRNLFESLQRFYKEKINLRKVFFNKYFLILAGIIFFAWLSSGDNTSYNGGTKALLPPPIQQASEESHGANNLDLSALNVSLTNGTIIKKNAAYLRGYGELVIKNGANLDAVAKLIRGGSSVLTVYIKANSNYTMTDISDGLYWLAFAQGLNWDSATKKFQRNTQYSVFDETFDFITTEDGQYYHYTTFEVTLNPVVGGTAETSSVDPAQFDAY